MPRRDTERDRVIGDRWGVSDAEVARRYPCDELTPNARMQAWRGITIRTCAERVWPWIVQIRLAPYSYDWIDNLGRRSPGELVGLADPVVGDPFSTAAGRPVGRVVDVRSGESLTAGIMGVVMSYVIVPDGPASRLLLKVVGRQHRASAALLCIGDLVMARRQLLNLARLAEQGDRRP